MASCQPEQAIEVRTFLTSDEVNNSTSSFIDDNEEKTPSTSSASSKSKKRKLFVPVHESQKKEVRASATRNKR